MLLSEAYSQYVQARNLLVNNPTEISDFIDKRSNFLALLADRVAGDPNLSSLSAYIGLAQSARVPSCNDGLMFSLLNRLKALMAETGEVNALTNLSIAR